MLRKVSAIEEDVSGETLKKTSEIHGMCEERC
jgi:hypothetical protein